MTARAAQGEGRDTGTTPASARAARAGLSALFAEHAAARPRALALVDQPGRESWCGRPRIAWSYGAAAPIVARLAAFFEGLRLPPGAPVALCLPAGSESLLTLLALERAGLTPCLLPLAWPRDDLARGIEATGAVAVVTQSLVGSLKPAETFRDIAMAYYGLRFVMAFGPQTPDGVLDLDRVMVDERPVLSARGEAPEESTAADENTVAPSEDEPGIVTLAPADGAVEAVFRPVSSWVAAAADVLAAAGYRPHERILSLVAPDDLAGLATGFVAALLAGCPLEVHGLFDGPALAASLAEGTPTRLVAPGWMEPTLGAARLPRCVTGLVLTHPAPARFRARSPLACPVTDVLALEPWALVARARGRGGHLAIRLDDRAGPGARSVVRRDETGRLQVSGEATFARRLTRSGPETEVPEWRETRWRAEVFAGILIGVS